MFHHTKPDEITYLEDIVIRIKKTGQPLFGLKDFTALLAALGDGEALACSYSEMGRPTVGWNICEIEHYRLTKQAQFGVISDLVWYKVNKKILGQEK